MGDRHEIENLVEDFANKQIASWEENKGKPGAQIAELSKQSALDAQDFAKTLQDKGLNPEAALKVVGEATRKVNQGLEERNISRVLSK